MSSVCLRARLWVRAWCGLVLAPRMQERLPLLHEPGGVSHIHVSTFSLRSACMSASEQAMERHVCECTHTVNILILVSLSFQHSYLSQLPLVSAACSGLCLCTHWSVAQAPLPSSPQT